MSYEQPDYTVMLADGDTEYRQYESYLVAETVIADTGAYKDAGNEGFRRLFRYITGANQARSDIAMTTPVTQANSTKIEMTTPVQQAKAGNDWVVSFTLPAQYTLDTAPVPTDSRVYVREVPGRLMAVQKFAGRWTDRNFLRREGRLQESLKARNVLPMGEFERAVYNAPFSLPFFRRNEVMVAVDRLPEPATSITEQQLAAY